MCNAKCNGWQYAIPVEDVVPVMSHRSVFDEDIPGNMLSSIELVLLTEGPFDQVLMPDESLLMAMEPGRLLLYNSAKFDSQKPSVMRESAPATQTDHDQWFECLNCKEAFLAEPRKLAGLIRDTGNIYCIDCLTEAIF